MRILASLVSMALLVSVGVAIAADPKTDDDKTFYALGIALSRNLAVFDLKPSELEFVQQGLADGVLDKDKNQVRAKVTKISAVESSADIWIVPTNEELVVARQTEAVLNAN